MTIFKILKAFWHMGATPRQLLHESVRLVQDPYYRKEWDEVITGK